MTLRVRKVMLAGLVMVVLTACKGVDSIPVFSDGRLTVQTLNAISGRYATREQSVQVQRASTETDLLSWVWYDEEAQRTMGHGNAVVSHVPSSNLMLALLLDVELSFEDGGVAGGAGANYIAFIRRDGPDQYRFIGVKETSFLSRMIDAVSDPAMQERLILDYATDHAAHIASMNGVDYVRQYDTPQAAPAAPSGPSAAEVARDRARQQCRSQVAERLLYCDEEVNFSGFSTTYVIDCPGGSRSEKRECRGWYNESTYPAVGFDPYYCDPQTDIKGATADQVIGQVCQ